MSRFRAGCKLLREEADQLPRHATTPRQVLASLDSTSPLSSSPTVAHLPGLDYNFHDLQVRGWPVCAPYHDKSEIAMREFVALFAGLSLGTLSKDIALLAMMLVGVNRDIN